MLDLAPATSELARIVEGVRDDQLTAPTPCAGSSLGDLLDHVAGLSVAFAAAATKTRLAGGSQPRADASQLAPDWRTRIPAQLDALAAAWRTDAAWAGVTEAGGGELPAQVMGLVALDEVIVHGWDIAKASGQPFSCDANLIPAAQQFVQGTVERYPQGSRGLFGPPVPVSADASPLDRLIALTGRDPAWRPA